MLSTIVLLASSLFVNEPQKPDTAAYLDPAARMLVDRARVAREELGRSIRSYSAVVKSRVGVSLRTPLKDRMLFRHESAARVLWSRDQEHIIQMLGARTEYPGPSSHNGWEDNFAMDELFDPAADRLYFGVMSDHDNDNDVWVEHPLIEGSETHYRFQSGDTITMSFPDGRKVSVVELRILPRENSARLMTGSVWIESQSGAIVKAAYRLARALDIEKDTNEFDDDEDLKHIPGVLRPMEFDITMISIEYSYWRMKHWLPRSMRMEGSARAGIMVAPAAMEVSYQVESVEDDEDSVVTNTRALLREFRAQDSTDVRPGRQNGMRTYTVYPEDRDKLSRSPDLPPPIWESSPEFITERELRKMYDDLAELPAPPVLQHGQTLSWGLQAKDLARFNRVEGLSLGVRAATTQAIGVLDGTARVGIADLHPNASVRLTRETMRRTIQLTAAHELVALDDYSLGFGNSASALLLGRDEGEYHYTTRFNLGLAPPRTRAEWYTLDLFVQRDASAASETNWSLPRLFSAGNQFRPNIDAADATLAGAALMLKQWWGTQALGWQGGATMRIEGVAGDYRFARASATVRAAFPFLAGLRAALEAGGGTSEGTLPIQRNFFLGGARNLRGYAGSAAVGTSFLRARAELARTSRIGGLALFSDAGWAGERKAFSTDHALLSAGVGATLLDGLIRVDLAKALRKPTGWRFELYLDALL